jgi:uncharacterized membrane protein
MHRTFEEEQKALQQLIGKLLRTGITISSLIILSGGILYLLQQGAEPRSAFLFDGGEPHFTSISGVAQGILHGNSQSIIQAGILLLIATPVARIAFSLAGFIRERDRLYIIISFIVLTILIASMLSGIK